MTQTLSLISCVLLLGGGGGGASSIQSLKNDGPRDGDKRTMAGGPPGEKMKAGEGKVICHNDRDGGGGRGGRRGQTSAAFEWTKVKEIIFVSSGAQTTTTTTTQN